MQLSGGHKVTRQSRGRILVCVGAHPKTTVLMRAALNRARETGEPWGVLYVETPDHFTSDPDSRERVLRYLTLARELGGEVYHIEGHDVLGSMVNFIHDEADNGRPVQYVIIGQTARRGLISRLRPSLAERLTRELRQYTTIVHIMPLSGRYETPNWSERLELANTRVREIGFAVTSVVCAFILAEVMELLISDTEWRLNVHNVSAFFLIATIISALRYGLVPGLVSALLGFSAINYFFVPPFQNFGINHSGDGISLVIFLLSAAVVSLLGAISRANSTALRRKNRQSQALYEIHRLASEAATRPQALEIMHRELSKILEMNVAFFMPPAMNPDAIELAYPESADLSENDQAVLERCWEYVRTTGLGTSFRNTSSWRFEPLLTPNGEIGVMGVRIPGHIRLDASFGRLLTALADRIGAILHRLELTRLMSESQVREEREKLRAMLLSSVSHDLKTPLASIIGSLSVYKRMRKSGRLTDDTADELADTALSEAQRLDSFISNILDMTRIESGEIEFDSEWVNVGKPVAAIEKRLRQRLKQQQLVIERPADDYEVKMDLMMTEQVLQNLVDNASKYAPPDTTITLTLQEQDDGFAYHVRDEGPGIPDDKLEAVFDKYERLKQSDSKTAGTGLGLAICKAVMDKQRGKVFAANHPEGGAIFTVWFPIYRVCKPLIPDQKKEDVPCP